MSSSDVKSSNSADNALRCCSHSKFYQTFIFFMPIFFAFILLFWFYSFYLCRQRVQWSSLRLTPTDISTCELGLKKELREMLPIIIFKESFTVKDTQSMRDEQIVEVYDRCHLSSLLPCAICHFACVKIRLVKFPTTMVLALLILRTYLKSHSFCFCISGISRQS